MADSKKYDGSTWQHSLRKLGTSTDIITTLPADIYADGNTATVGLKGNMQQTGTPTPQNPIQPSETGERTANLLNPSNVLPNTMFNVNANPPAFVYSDTFDCSNYVSVTSDTYLRTLNNVAVGNYFFEFDANKNFLRQRSPGEGVPMKISNDASYITFNIYKTYDITKYMFARTSTPIPYEPYGVKIPISSANITTPVYLGEVQTTRKIYKYEFKGSETWGTGSENYYSLVPETSGDGVPYSSVICSHCSGSTINSTGKAVFVKKSEFPNITTGAELKQFCADQYAAGTPVCVWYVLATPQTAVVNEPLRKIGTYADTISGITIPTITGADSFDVLTTLKPSEVELTYTGWHDTTVKEWDGSDWN